VSQIGGWSGWLTVIFAGLVTLCIRASFIVMPADTQVPEWLTGALKFVGAAVLPALIVPDVLFRDAAAGDIFNYYRIIAAMAAAAFALKTKNTLGTLCVGMAVLWILMWWRPF
jgi:branched-subunit amino acid transport protein